MRATSYLDQELDMVPMLALSRHVSYGLEKFKPDVVYTHWPVDLNQDHRRVAEAVLIATRLVAGSTVRRVLAGEVPESTHQAFGAPAFSPTVFVSLDEASAERKCRALACYVSESRPYPHPRSVEAVEERMRMWGGLAGVGRSEAFVLLREVVP
jgi:LmbE family N-acetylglucosaminyl deacetylase